MYADLNIICEESKARKQDGFYREEEGDFDDESGNIFPPLSQRPWSHMLLTRR